MKKAIIIGSTSGIGRELAKLLTEHGYCVGIAGRREEELEKLRSELPDKFFVRRMDIAEPESAVKILEELVTEMQGLDLLVVSAGVGHVNPELSWKKEKETIDVNVSGFTAIADAGMLHFLKQGRGHLVGISSIAAFRGGAESPAYNASKAYVSNYLEGLRFKAGKSGMPISVAEIIPGFVDTNMAKSENLFWVAPVRKAALQIFKAIRKKKARAYITKRWRIIAWLLKLLPDFICQKM